MMVNRIEKGLEALRAYSLYGHEISQKHKTELIGRATHIAPMAWLHKIFSPLNEGEILSLEEKMKIKLHKSFRDFLLLTNGLKIFNTTLCIYGLRKNYSRTIEDVWQPFDIVVSNKEEKPKNLSNKQVVIGGYDWDNSVLVINNNIGEVFCYSTEEKRILKTWDTFEDMLLSEIIRLSKLFDERGVEINTSVSTLP